MQMAQSLSSIFRSFLGEEERKQQRGKEAGLKFLVEGKIERTSDGSYRVGTTDFKINADTWIIGILEYGSMVKVSGSSRPGGRVATKIVITSPAERS